MKEPKISDNKPKAMVMEPGTYYWCSCGKSSKQPFCDGSHLDTHMAPVPVKIEEKKEVFWCMCKHSKNKPFCDGSHNNLK